MPPSISTADALQAPAVIAGTRRAGLHGGHVLIEIFREAMHGLVRNRFRAGLAMLGISWGIVSVVMLLAYGNGFRDALAAGFANAFGSGVVISWPGQTSMQAGGERAGRRVRVTVEDVLQLSQLPLVKAVSPELVEEQAVSYGTKQSSYLIRAVAPAYGPMRTEIPLPGGRFIDDEDIRLHRRVAFIGTEVNRKLFGESDADRPVDPHPRHLVRSDRRDEGEGAAVELLQVRRAVRLHPLHRREPGLVSAVRRRRGLAGRRCEQGARRRASGVGAARAPGQLQPERRARAAGTGVRPRAKK